MRGPAFQALLSIRLLGNLLYLLHEFILVLEFQGGGGALLQMGQRNSMFSRLPAARTTPTMILDVIWA
jgi:hypothetical protein